MRGRFTADDAHAAAITLMAYTIGLVLFVLIRSVVAPFLARGDTFTPMKAALIGTAVNIAFKVALMGPLAQVGLALATSIGAWINFALVLFWAARANFVGADAELRSSLTKLCGAGLAMALLLFLAAPLISHAVASLPRFRNESELVVLAALGALLYGGLVIALFGRRLRSFVRRRGVVKTGDPTAEA
jgi:putative peptidoglycan lipid II flippase